MIDENSTKIEKWRNSLMKNTNFSIPCSKNFRPALSFQQLTPILISLYVQLPCFSLVQKYENRKGPSRDYTESYPLFPTFQLNELKKVFMILVEYDIALSCKKESFLTTFLVFDFFSQFFQGFTVGKCIDRYFWMKYYNQRSKTYSCQKA